MRSICEWCDASLLPGLSCRRCGGATRDSGHAVLIENCADGDTVLLEDPVELITQRLVLSAHADRDVEYFGHEGQVDLRRHRHELERNRLLFREVSRKRTPCNGDVDFAFRDGVDDSRRRARLTVV